MKLTRTEKIVLDTIQKFNLKMNDFVVYTEAATNNYQFTPIICALTGAKKVFAVTRDSYYGKKETIANNTMKLAKKFKVENKISIVFEKKKEDISQADIITNSGFVRPINKQLVSWMKPIAVIPLMWETWELRSCELDLDECRKRGILVLGTNEHHEKLRLFRSNFFLICKLMFECGLGVYKDNLLLVGDSHINESLADYLVKTSVDFKWITINSILSGRFKTHCVSKEEAVKELEKFDAIIVADHRCDIELIGENGLLTPSIINQKNEFMCIIHIWGKIDKERLKQLNIKVHPDFNVPYGYMNVSPDYLGPKTTIELIIAGLHVGATMAKCRREGMTVEDTIKYSLKNSLAMDF